MAEQVYYVSDTNCTTGVETVRPMTPEEIAIAEGNVAEIKARKEAQVAEEARISALKVSAKSKLIAGEPLTEEEASVLVI
jgi:hypothetical protein